MQYYAPNDNVPSLQWECEHEDDSRQQYVSMLEGQHCNLQTSPSGLIIDPCRYSLYGGHHLMVFALVIVVGNASLK